MAANLSAPLRDRVAVIETELPHLNDKATEASKLAHKTAREVQTLQFSLEGLSTELKQMREMLRRYLQIGSMLALAMVLQTTGGKVGEILAVLGRAFAVALRHAF